MPGRFIRDVAMLVVLFAARPASAYAVGTAVPLEDIANKADLVCKATVVAERVVADAWFDRISGFEVRETELRVISIIKGPADAKVVRFRHYAPAPGPTMYAPQSYELAVGRSYIVFAAKAGGGYRQVWKSHTIKPDQGVVLAGDDKPHRGKTATEAVWAELRGLLANSADADVTYGIAQLDEMSGGHDTSLADFDRKLALDAIRPLITRSSIPVASAAIHVFGADSQYFDDAQAAFWLAGIGGGTVAGMGARKPPVHPTADLAITELVAVADGSGHVELRALAVRALGRSHAVPVAKIEAWSRDPSTQVRRAAVLVSAELADRKLIVRGASDAQPDVRHAAALAIGYTQDPALVPLLDKLLKDGSANVREAAALSLVSFAPDRVAAVLAANLAGDYGSIFVNAVARRNAKPYLARLAEVIEKQQQPSQWWGGSTPAGDSWHILFDYIKGRPAAELGSLTGSLDALEHLKWFSSSEPRDLYALYLRRGLTVRAKKFRDATRKTAGFDMERYFDMADKSPQTYVP